MQYDRTRDFAKHLFVADQLACLPQACKRPKYRYNNNNNNNNWNCTGSCEGPPMVLFTRYHQPSDLRVAKASRPLNVLLSGLSSSSSAQQAAAAAPSRAAARSAIVKSRDQPLGGAAPAWPPGRHGPRGKSARAEMAEIKQQPPHLIHARTIPLRVTRNAMQ